MIEMMMVIVIVAILAAVGMPSMVDMIRTSRVRTSASDFYAALLTARSEAIKRRTTITMAPISSTEFAVRAEVETAALSGASLSRAR